MNSTRNHLTESVSLHDLSNRTTNPAGFIEDIPELLQSPQSVVFIDAAIENIDSLIAGIEESKIVLLDSDTNGIQQIGDVLAQHNNLTSVHILSHGDAGTVQLGNTALNANTVATYANELQQWGDALTEEGDLLFYGCNVGANVSGMALVNRLSDLTGADIAASDDLTGYGGDWDLEIATGNIEAAIALDGATQASYQGTFVTYNGREYQLTSSNMTWEQAQAAAEQLGGNLVAINDAAEETWLKQTFGDRERFWIGLTDRTQEGNFQWVNGQNTSYRNWASGEPNDYQFNGAFTAGEDYTLMNWGSSRQWNDMPNSYAGTFRGIIEIADDGNLPQNLVTNGSFENNAIAANTWGIVNNLEGWTPTIQSGIEVQELTNTFGSADDGTAWVELDSNRNGGITQSLDTVAQERYQLSFAYSPRANVANSSNGIAVYWDGEVLDTISRPGGSSNQWQTYTYDVTANTTSTALEFRAVGTSDGLGGFIDDVQVREMNPTEPGNPGVIGLETSTIVVNEAEGTATVNILRNQGSDGTVTVDYRTVAGSATVGEDYTAQSGTVTFAPGVTSQSVVIPILNDTLAESNETFGFAIDNVTGGATLLVPRTAQVTIEDNDTPPVVGTGNGLRAEYYNNINFTDRALTRTDSTVNFNWGGGSPDASIGADTFSARWSGQIEALYSETYTFQTTTDDGVRLWVNDRLIIDRFVDQAATNHTGSIDLAAGQRYDIRLEYYENGGAAVSQLAWSSASQAFEIVPQSQLYSEPLPSPGTGNGLRAEYYNNIDFTDRALTRTDSTVNFNWGGGSPDASIGADTFSARWSGQIEALYSETYTFQTTTDDGVRLWVNDRLIIDRFVDQGATSHTGSIDLVAGQRYDIRLEYYENGGAAVSQLAWSSASQAFEIVPQSQLYSEPLQTLSSETIVSNLVTPTAVDWISDGSKMFVAEQRGVVKVYENGTLQSTPFIDLSAQVNGTRDRGLLDIAVHPDFENNPYVYLLYTYDPPEVFNNTGLAGPDGNGNRAARLTRVTADPNTNYRTAIPGSEVVLLGTNSTWENFNGFANSTVNFNEPPAGILADGTNLRDFLAADSESHTIGTVEFGPDGALYVTNGDGTSYNRVDPRTVRVQDIDNLSGKVLRIDPITGAGLADNPFYNGDANANRSKVYQYGLRNPFRMAVHPDTGQVYVGDVGWTQWEEINAAGPGANFGWPFFEGGSGNSLQTGGYRDLPEAQAFYNSGQSTTPSIFALNHAADGINAIVMGDIYTGTLYPEEYSGDLFFNDLGQGIVRNISFDASGNIASVDTFTTGANVVVQIMMGPDGYLYYVDLDDGVVGRWTFV